FPRYAELRQLRSDGTPYAEEDFRDLQVLFNLAWTDPSFLAEEPLASLVAKGRGFTEEDKAVLFAEHLRIIGEVIPLHARLWQQGNIEVTTTPLAHPILPLIADSAAASTGDPTAILPDNRFNEVTDAQDHVIRGLDLAERLLGTRPVGMWPGEGAVSQYVIPLFSGNGVQWIATGEDVLAPSLGLGSFTRDQNDTVQEADLLYRPWLGVPRRNEPVAMFFRDRLISDLVGFQYSGTPAEQAAADFMNRLQSIKDRLAAEGAAGPHVVSVILDGENAWENYPNDGIDFLRALYGALNDADWVRTVTPSQYLEAFGDRTEALDEVWPGAWFSSNYATWIGEPEEATAWDYLWEVRDDLHRFERSGDINPEALAAAYEKMLFAEGSDWFWWYGNDQSSGNDDYFDTAFRELLGQVYDAMGQDRPAFVSVPIIPETPALPTRGAGEEPLAVTIDGQFPEDEWADAAAYLGEDGSAIYFGITPDGLHFRFDWAGEFPVGSGFDLYLGVPGALDPRPTTLGGQLLGFGATHLFRYAGGSGVTSAAPLPPLGTSEVGWSQIILASGADASRVEFTIPLAALGALEAGDLLPFRVVTWDASGETGRYPSQAPAAAQVPDISNVDVFLEVADPEGDDHGPGSYTYPSDSVFTAGSYDLTNVAIGTEGADLVITLEVLATIANSWGSPNGLSIQTFDIYVDQDPGAGTGARLLIPGRNAALQEGSGWEYGITVEGWYPAIYVAQPDGTAEETTPTFRVIVLGDKGKVIVRVPLELLGGDDPTTWGYAVALMSQEGYPSSGVRRIRDVMATAEQWRLGGAPAAGVTHTRIMDLLSAEEGLQELVLSGYTPAASVEELTPDQFAQIPLLTAQ
ncbi:MAG: glycoside hydrolase, partial [Acidimicrobiia bacterium]|nr:glycoside hydrolase [Acidimicrobiia bacterium]